MSGQWNPEVRSRLVPTVSLRATLGEVNWLKSFDLAKLDLTHWLDIPQRVQYKLGVTVHRCLENKAPQYLMDYCTRTSDVSSCQRLRSANRHHSPVNDSTTPSQHVWSSGVLLCGSDGMELASTLTQGPCLEYRRLQIGAENSSFCDTKGRLAH